MSETFELDYFKPANHPRGNSPNLNDYGGGSRYLFCLINEKNEQITFFSGCRAYVVDSVFAINNNLDFSTACFWKDYRTTKLDKLRLGVKMSTDKSAIIVDFLNKLERDLGFEPTKVYKETGLTKYVIYKFEADKKWIRSMPLLSLYMLLIRSINHHKLENTWQETLKECQRIGIETDYDADLWTKITAWLERFKKYGVHKFFKRSKKFNYSDKLRVYAHTHGFGIMAFVNLDNSYYLKTYVTLANETKEILSYASENLKKLSKV